MNKEMNDNIDNNNNSAGTGPDQVVSISTVDGVHFAIHSPSQVDSSASFYSHKSYPLPIDFQLVLDSDTNKIIEITNAE